MTAIPPAPDTIPSPGSDAALKLGCRCPVMDNGHGRGVMLGGAVCFWIMEDCPLHGRKPELQEREAQGD